MSDKIKTPATRRRNKNDDCIIAATHQSTTTYLVTENDSNFAVTCVGIIQEKTINQIIDTNTTFTYQINEDMQHHT